LAPIFLNLPSPVFFNLTCSTQSYTLSSIVIDRYSNFENTYLSKQFARSIVIDRYSNFENTYLSKQFARVLGPGQIVASLEHLARAEVVQA